MTRARVGAEFGTWPAVAPAAAAAAAARASFGLPLALELAGPSSAPRRHWPGSGRRGGARQPPPVLRATRVLNPNLAAMMMSRGSQFTFQLETALASELKSLRGAAGTKSCG